MIHDRQVIGSGKPGHGPVVRFGQVTFVLPLWGNEVNGSVRSNIPNECDELAVRRPRWVSIIVRLIRQLDTLPAIGRPAINVMVGPRASARMKRDLLAVRRERWGHLSIRVWKGGAGLSAGRGLLS